MSKSSNPIKELNLLEVRIYERDEKGFPVKVDTFYFQDTILSTDTYMGTSVNEQALKSCLDLANFKYDASDTMVSFTFDSETSIGQKGLSIFKNYEWFHTGYTILIFVK